MKTHPKDLLVRLSESGIESKKKNNIPDRLWDYGNKYFCETDNMTFKSSRYSNGRTPLEIITGKTPYVPEYLDF